MAILETVMSVPTSVAAGTWSPVGNLIGKQVQLAGAVNGTYVLQGSCEKDQSNPFDVQTLTTPDVINVEGMASSVRWLRWNCTQYVSGAPTAKIFGRIG